MKDKLKYVFLLIISLFVVWISPVLTRADSGWDFDYDSGGSWDGGGGWDGGYDGGSSGGGVFVVNSYVDSIVSVIMMFIIIYFIIVFLKMKYDHRNVKEPELVNIVTDETLQKYNINKDELIDEIYNKYVNVQESWMNFDYDKMKKLLTDELFNSYSSQLKVLKLKNQKNVMSGFEFLNCKIIEIKEENGIRSIDVALRVKQYDYVVNEENEVVRGNKNKKNEVTYELVFVKSINPDNVVICPNCGAESKVITGDNCEYCKSKIVIPPKEFVLSKKKVVSQR